ncbi:MAG TPA: hypothetical protein VEU55_06270 [Gemmatimonadales bacterium]|nr:hypothetical protein [Gemmatimonadales bacterium]
MLELPELTPEAFEILVVRELRKVGLEVSALRIHRRTTLPEPERGYLLELKGVLSRVDWQTPVLIACRRQAAPIAAADIASVRAHLEEVGVPVGILFSTAPVTPEALSAATDGSVVLLRVADGRTAFDTSGWGTPGHYPAWLPAYCAQAVDRDVLGEPRYQLLESGHGEVIVRQILRSDARRGPDGAGPPRGAPA